MNVLMMILIPTYGTTGVTFAFVFYTIISIAASVSHGKCNGTVDFSILYNDGQIKNVTVDEDSVSDSTITTNTPIALQLQGLLFKPRESFAGENGLTINNERYNILLIPGGRSDSYVVHLFDYTTKAWNTIDVYCQPLGLAYRRERDVVVGFCRVNTTYYDGTIMCVPYFVLRMENDKWVDVSRSGLCSQALSTANITNPVILQGDTDIEFDAVRLYFGERGTNRLHEVSLSAGEANFYETDNPTLKIDHLIPVSNASFFGLRVVCNVENSTSLYQKLFSWQMDSTQQGFISGFVLTESTAFDSYNLDYLVTFNANRNTVIIKENGQSKYYPLLHPLDDPIQCQNLVGPVMHNLICLAGNGHLPLLINVTDNRVTNQTISIDKSKKVINIGMLAENSFYLLNDQQELSIYLVSTTAVYLGTYSIRPNIDFIITAAFSNITCHYNNVSFDMNADESEDESYLTVIIAIVTSISFVLVIVFIVIIIIVYYWKAQHTVKFNDVDDKSDGAIGNDTVSNHSTATAQPVSDYPSNGEQRGAGVDIPTVDQNRILVEAHQETMNGSGHRTTVNGITVNYAYMPNSLPMAVDIPESSTDPSEGQLQCVNPIQSTDDNLSIPKLSSFRLDPDGK